MDSRIAKEVIRVVRAEGRQGSERLKDEDPDFAYDQWLFNDEPFINEMCLMVLAALHHQVERELVLLAARADGEATVTSQQYETNLKKWHDKSPRCRRLDLCKALNLRSFVEWDKSMETLRLLANCLKHDAHKKPSKKLLEHLNLPNVLNRPNIDQLVDAYLPLPESFFLKEGLAKSVNLPEDADYCAITDAFADLCNQFLDDVRGKTNAARITGIRISFAG